MGDTPLGLAFGNFEVSRDGDLSLEYVGHVDHDSFDVDDEGNLTVDPASTNTPNPYTPRDIFTVAMQPTQANTVLYDYEGRPLGARWGWDDDGLIPKYPTGVYAKGVECSEFTIPDGAPSWKRLLIGRASFHASGGEYFEAGFQGKLGIGKRMRLDSYTSENQNRSGATSVDSIFATDFNAASGVFTPTLQTRGGLTAIGDDIDFDFDTEELEYSYRGRVDYGWPTWLAPSVGPSLSGGSVFVASGFFRVLKGTPAGTVVADFVSQGSGEITGYSGVYHAPLTGELLVKNARSGEVQTIPISGSGAKQKAISLAVQTGDRIVIEVSTEGDVPFSNSRHWLTLNIPK
jgi:hypothetical protein